MSKYKKPELDGHWQLVDLVYRNSGLRGNARLVAWSLAQKYYPKKGYSAYPVSMLCEDTGLSNKTVIAALKDIADSGEWNAVKKVGATTRFYPNMDKLSVKQPTFKKGAAEDTSWVERLHPTASKNKGTAEAPTEPTDSVPDAIEAETPDNIEDIETPDIAAPVVQRVLPDENWSVFENPGDILRPSVLKSARSCAARLHKRTPLDTRKNKEDFTIESLTRLYTRLSEKYPLLAVDTLLWIQCEEAQPLNDKFLGLVLSKCTANGQIIAPAKSKNTPADKTAMKVWMLHQARTWKPQQEKKKRYQEAL